MKKLMGFRSRQGGFTLIELLIVVAILGILAAVVVPNLVGFLTTGKVAAANTEVANVESAALAYYADHDGVFPLLGTAELIPPDADYLSAAPKQPYTFDEYGKVIPSNPDDWDGSGTVVWDITPGAHKWIKK